MLDKRISVLGTDYEIICTTPKEDPKLKGCAGYCDFTIKGIRIDDFEPCENSLNDIDVFKRKVVRHEIIHAFLLESGLDGESDWAQNEEMVDYFARQFEKIYKAFKEADALEEQRSSKTLNKIIK